MDVNETKKSLIRKPDIVDYGKLPPQAIPIERQVLGVIMTDRAALLSCAKFLFEDIFYVDAHQRIWRAIQALLDAGSEVDILLVVEQLKRHGELDAAGGPFFVTQLTNVSHWNNVLQHTFILHQMYVRRKMISTSSEIIRDAYEDTTDEFDLCEKAVESFMKILGTVKNKQKKNFNDVLEETLLDVKNRYTGLRRSMFKTGWKEFDKTVSLDKPRLIVVPANKKIGKTRFMLSLAKHIIEHNENCAFMWFTLEMGAAENVLSFISMECDLTMDQLKSRDYRMTKTETELVAAAKKKFQGYPIEFVEATTGITDVRTRYKSFCADNTDKDCFLVIDNHGYVVDDPKNEEAICKAYVDIRTETGSVLFVLHHLTTKGNRDFTIDNGYQPQIDMIRGNTRLIDYCNTALLLHRPSFYKDLMHRLKMELHPDRYEMIAKLFLVDCVLNRDGETGLIRLEHQIQYSKFNNFKTNK